jgi:hypothetical protein
MANDQQRPTVIVEHTPGGDIRCFITAVIEIDINEVDVRAFSEDLDVVKAVLQSRIDHPKSKSKVHSVGEWRSF